jgi:hypothetical protein
MPFFINILSSSQQKLNGNNTMIAALILALAAANMPRMRRRFGCVRAFETLTKFIQKRRAW